LFALTALREDMPQMFLAVVFCVVDTDSNAVIANKNEFVADIAVLSACKYTFDSYYKPKHDATYQENQA
jgi:dTDP-4-dehydrorhamnose 3,5-epimerase-like enzyme